MAKKTPKSHAAFRRAKQTLVGGVNSPVRAFAAVGSEPITIASARAAHITDVDGNDYVDYVGSFGPLIVGHAHRQVVDAISAQVSCGTSYGAPSEPETLLAEQIVSAIDSAEKVRFVSSGTEAAMTAVRLARGVTGRDKIIKCAGCYHGHMDGLLVSAGSGATTLGVPSSPGVPAGTVSDTLLVNYNDLPAVAQTLAENAGQVAAMLVEPVAGNMGVIPPDEGYLAGLRLLCDEHGTLLIFDEVMTGFRVAHGGAQALYGVRPDLTVLGKIIGGGMPVGAVAGPARIMDQLAPLGPIYQAGTLSGNPVAMAAGLATLDLLAAEGFYEQLELKSAILEAGLRQASDKAGMGGAVCLNRVGSMLCCFFAEAPVNDYAAATAANTDAFAAYFRSMLDDGIYLPPSQFEAIFISAAHSDADLSATITAAESAMKAAASLM